MELPRQRNIKIVHLVRKSIVSAVLKESIQIHQEYFLKLYTQQDSEEATECSPSEIIFPSTQKRLWSPPALQMNIFGRYCRDSRTRAILLWRVVAVHRCREKLFQTFPTVAHASRGSISFFLLYNFTV